VAAALACYGMGGTARAEDEEAPTFFLQATGGYSVYKSEMVQSNDTSTTVGYGFGVYAGTQRNVGMMLRREQSAFSFALNNSTIALEWQDVHLRYRWGPVSIGGVVSSSSWQVTAPPDADGDGFLDQDTEAVDYLDITTTGYGLNVATTVPVGKRGRLTVDATYVTTSDVQAAEIKDDAGETVERTAALGPRMDTDFGGAVELSKGWLYGLMGFRYRTYQIIVDDTAYAEAHNSTYVGFQAGWTF
jgi:hypothetical protein